MKKRMSWCE